LPQLQDVRMTISIEEERAAITSAIAPATDKAGIVTAWVVVAEFMDEEGKKFLQRLDSEGMTVWQRNGMLRDALCGDNWDDGE